MSAYVVVRIHAHLYAELLVISRRVIGVNQDPG
jgi:hypothetical protein